MSKTKRRQGSILPPYHHKDFSPPPHNPRHHTSTSRIPGNCPFMHDCSIIQPNYTLSSFMARQCVFSISGFGRFLDLHDLVDVDHSARVAWVERINRIPPRNGKILFYYTIGTHDLESGLINCSYNFLGELYRIKRDLGMVILRDT